eukprot:g77120.t1
MAKVSECCNVLIIGRWWGVRASASYHLTSAGVTNVLLIDRGEFGAGEQPGHPTSYVGQDSPENSPGRLGRLGNPLSVQPREQFRSTRQTARQCPVQTAKQSFVLCATKQPREQCRIDSPEKSPGRLCRQPGNTLFYLRQDSPENIPGRLGRQLGNNCLVYKTAQRRVQVG